MGKVFTLFGFLLAIIMFIGCAKRVRSAEYKYSVEVLHVKSLFTLGER